MKLEIALSGTYQRTANNQPSLEPVALKEWIQSYQAVATQVRQRSPHSLRQHFGLGFLPESSLVQLLQEEYQFPVLQWLHPLEADVAQPILHQYQFISSTTHIDLQPDDPQIPTWQPGETSLPGVYDIVLDVAPQENDWCHSLWQQAQQVWQNTSPLEILQMALQSAAPDCFQFHLSTDVPAIVHINISEAPAAVQEAIAYLRSQLESSRSPAAQTLVDAYWDSINEPIPFPQALSIKPSAPSCHQFLIGKRNRREIEDLVSQAEQFLLISSYIIEDPSLTELICHQAATLPQGVWILTNLQDEVVDRLDTHLEQAYSPDYQRCDRKKAQCLTMLLEAGAQIRGGLFHLKTYISERAAYLGSCNLTGGSLDFNLEGGLICQGTPAHRELIRYFNDLWQSKAEYAVFPSCSQDFVQRSLKHSSAPDRTSQCLLSPTQYRKDLQQELKQSREQVEIFSRGFDPDAELLSLLKTHSTRVHFESFTSLKNSHIEQRFLSGLHAKITLIGDRVAYIGGINFQFQSPKSNVIDLMYKTCDRHEIAQIRQRLDASYF